MPSHEAMEPHDNPLGLTPQQQEEYKDWLLPAQKKSRRALQLAAVICNMAVVVATTVYSSETAEIINAAARTVADGIEHFMTSKTAEEDKKWLSEVGLHAAYTGSKKFDLHFDIATSQPEVCRLELTDQLNGYSVRAYYPNNPDSKVEIYNDPHAPSREQLAANLVAFGLNPGCTPP